MTKIRVSPALPIILTPIFFGFLYALWHSGKSLTAGEWAALIILGIFFLVSLIVAIYPTWGYDEQNIYQFKRLGGGVLRTWGWSQVKKVGVETGYSSRGVTSHYYALYMDDGKIFRFLWFFITNMRILTEVVQRSQAANPEVEIDPRVQTKLEAPFYTQMDLFDMGYFLFIFSAMSGISIWGIWKHHPPLGFYYILGAASLALVLWFGFLLTYKLIHLRDHPVPKKGAPMEATLQKEPHPLYVTYGLLAVLGVVYILETVYAIDGKNAFAGPGMRSITLFGASDRDFVLGLGQWYRLLTSTLLHANPQHLIDNGVAFFLAGLALEGMVGRSWFFTIFVLSGLSGSLVSLYFNSSFSLSLGASGAIMGLMAASVIVCFKLPKGPTRSWILWLLFPMLAMNLIPHGVQTGEQVDLFGHLGGAICGAVMALFLFDTWNQEEPLPAFEGLAKLLALGGVVALLWTGSIPVRVYAHDRDLAAKLIPVDPSLSYDKRVAQSAKWVAQYPDDPKSHSLRAEAYSRAHNPQGAVKELRLALEKQEVIQAFYGSYYETWVRVWLGEWLAWQHKIKEAKEVVEPLSHRRLEPDIEKRYTKLGL